MFDARVLTSQRAIPWWLLVLGACTAWLVVQNTLLVLTLSFASPDRIASLVSTLVRAAVRFAPLAWLIPVAGAMLGAVLLWWFAPLLARRLQEVDRV
jgi:hypothetical protein